MKFRNKKFDEEIAIYTNGKGDGATLRIVHREGGCFSDLNPCALYLELKEAIAFKKLFDIEFEKLEKLALETNDDE